MTNEEKYLAVFTGVLEMEKEQVENLRYQEVPAWDSVGHMNLIAEIEKQFDIMMDTVDIIDFNSYEKGKEILSVRYGVEF